jgi:DNA-binding transcriptional regulator YiaG
MSVIEIAAKQRHLLLLKKVRNNQPLTQRELKELQAIESMSKEAKDKTTSVIASQKEAADYCGVSTRTMREWEKQDTLRDADGNYIKSRLDERVAAREIDGNPLRTRLLTADAEYKETKSELARMQLAVRTGELLPRGDVEAGRLARVVETRRTLLAIVRKLPPLLGGRTQAQMTAIIRREVYQTLTVFAGGAVEEQDGVQELISLYESLSAAQKKQVRQRMAERPKHKKNSKDAESKAL